MILRVNLGKWITLLGVFATSNVLAIFGTNRIAPTIRVKKGNLFIESTRNITLQADGSVNIQGQDLKAVIRMLELIGPRLNNLGGGTMYNPDFWREIRALREMLMGNDGVLARITRLEGVIRTSNLNDSNTDTLDTISRKVYVLEKRVANLRRSLTHDNCVSNPCMNGALCEDKYNGFICRCQPGWEGPRCDVDINECARYNDSDLGCQNGATCSNTPGSYQCWCPPGFFGKNCNTRSNDCNLASSRNLCDHGTCVNQPTKTGFKCICDQGWTTDPATGACSVDINECVGRAPPCSVDPHVECINVPGTFVCGSCPAGFTGNGFHCVDIDECQINNGGCSTSPSVQCINTRGSRRCGPCPPGYQGNGEVCNLVGLCTINNGGCHPAALCISNAGPVPICLCKPGFVGPGTGPNGCVPATRGRGSCISNPCLNGGTCFDDPSGFTCACPPHFAGAVCGEPFSPCMSNPCANNGTCIEETQGFRCECAEGFTGWTCRNQQEACGGYINQQSGELRFPLKARQYPHGVNCGWVITTNSSYVLNVTFLDFHLEVSRNCNFDWLQIHDGASSGDHQIGRYCGTKKPGGGNIISTHNTLYLWFRSDSSVSRDGFRLRWESIRPVCGSNIDLVSHASISSPGAPGKYPANRDCVWVLKADPKHRIQLNFFSLQIESHPNCSYDYLEIRSHVEPFDVLGRYCNTSHPPPLVSPGNEVEIRFHSDAKGQDTGFQIAASVVIGMNGCGGILTTARGQIQPPLENDEYLANTDCTWKIQLPTKEKIRVTVPKFQLEWSPDCRLDFLEIRDGADSAAPLYGRFCGRDAPASFMSNGNTLLVHFRTDVSLNLQGFILKYESVCGGSFSSSNGTITSPYYPSHYPDFKRCIYEIEVQGNQIISLAFDDFELETSRRCSLDYVEIRDGNNENATLVGRYCGSKIPDAVRSTTNSLYVIFRTDGSASGKGFKANFVAIDLECGGVLRAPTGVIESSQLDKRYRPSQKCTWIILAPKSHRIRVTWLSFNIHYDPHCNYDAVYVFDNNTFSNGGQLVGRFCGGLLPPPFTSLENVVTVVFERYHTLAFEGFTMSYVLIDPVRACGGNYTLNSGVLRSPNYPSPYATGLDCTYLIRVKEGRQIRVNFTDFDLEPNSRCDYDYLEIWNGGNERAPLIGKFCDESSPSSFTSFTNELYLRFVSDNTVVRRGFLMYWDGALTGCGGSLTSSSGTITSPNYPQTYVNNGECIWSISTNLGSKLRVVFVDLKMVDTADCEFDYVELWNGLPGRGKKIGRYCVTVPEPFTTSGNNLYIKYHTSSAYGGRGFRIDYSTVCTTNLTGRQGIIENPDYPQVSSDRCHWIIAAPKGGKVNVTFLALTNNNIPTGPHQRMSLFLFLKKPSKLELKEAPDTLEPTTTLYSFTFDSQIRNSLPPTISSSKDHVHVIFNSDADNRGGAFRLEWTVDGCGGEFSHPSGYFATPNYPKAYPHNIECTWLIRVDLGYSIKLSIKDVNIEKSQRCIYDSLKIFGGPDETAPVLTEICHSTTGNINLTSSSNTMLVRFKSDSSFDGTGFQATYYADVTGCGGLMTASHGTIHSRNYPQNYDPTDDCTWVIKVDPGHVIRFDIRELDLVGSNVNCTGTYLALYDGEDTDSPELLKVCGNYDTPYTTTTTGNVLRVRMKADGTSSTAKGFIGNYSISCGAKIVTSGSGILETAGSASILGSNPNCSWIIMSEDPSKHITLTISNLLVAVPHQARNGECEDVNHVDIHEGMDSSGPLIGTYCEGYAPQPITSRGSALFVHLVSPRNQFHGWFSAAYSALSSYCGGSLKAASGTFASPGYPGSYPSNMDCEWTLAASPGNRVEVGFRSFSLTASAHCNDDFVEIRKNGPAGEMIGTYCGDNIPSNLTSTNALWIKFRSGSATTGPGFVADYTYVHGNLELGPPSGTISSPLYPLPYYGSDEVAWRILVSVSKRIQLNFQDFSMDRAVSNCDHTSNLQVFDGFDDTATRVLEACGNGSPDPITSSANALFIKYHPDVSRLGIKFLIEYLEISPNTTSVEIEGNVTVINLAPGDEKTITSPGYPDGYENNLNAVWIVETTPGSHIRLVFDVLDIESNGYTDFVTLYSGKTGPGKWELIEKYFLPTATQLKNITAGIALKIVFSTDGSFNETGFSAKVFAACGGEIVGPTGVIAVTNSTKYLIARQRFFSTDLPIEEFSCEWVIKVAPGRTIDVDVTSLEFPSIPTSDRTQNRCGNSFLLLRSGADANSVIGRYCSGRPHTNTSSNVLYVKFRPGSVLSKFKLKYQQRSTDCVNDINLSHQSPYVVISTPNYPNVPPPYSECIWRISGPLTERIRVDFLDRFDLTRSSGCKTAAVEMRDGGSENANIINRFCREMPGTVRSTGSMLYIRYYSDTADPKNGFKANVSIDVCGGTIRGYRGSISSPSYPHNYNRHLYCEWRIIAPEYLRMTITFTEFKVGMKWNPCFDYVSIVALEPEQDDSISSDQWTAFRNPSNESLGTFCGSEIPRNLTSPSNAVLVTFQSSPDSSGYKGFLLQFLTHSRSSCGGLFETLSGSFQSLGYPNKVYRGYCYWKIRVPRDRRVTLYFEDLDLSNNLSPSGTSRQRLAIYIENDGTKIFWKFLNFTTTVRTLDTSSNAIDVVFHSGLSSANRGVSLRYDGLKPAVCGGPLPMEPTELKAPSNFTVFSCKWFWDNSVSLKEALTLAVYVHGVFNNPYMYPCLKSQANVVMSSGSTELYRVCSNQEIQPILLSPYVGTSIIMTQGRFEIPSNISLTYSWSNCGGVLKSPREMSSPRFPEKYPPDFNCAWEITFDEGERITFKSLTFDLGSGDYLRIYNGPNAKSPMLGEFTKNTGVPETTSNKNKLWVVFHSDSTNEGNGFKMTFDTVSLACGQDFYDNSGEFTTPGYPRSYSNNMRCNWTIHSHDGYHIGLTFEGRFNIEESSSCAKDFVEVFDKRGDNWESLGKVCGRNLPVPFNSSGTSMKIVFNSDDYRTSEGFKWSCSLNNAHLKVKAVGKSRPEGAVFRSVQARWNWNCGQEIVNSTQGYIMSPGYPLGYPPDLNCTYIVRFSQKHISVKFEQFNLEGGTSCQFDSVTFKVGNQLDEDLRRGPIWENGEQKGPYCGDTMPPPFRAISSFLLNFRSDGWVNRKGFKLKYTVNECNDNITSPTEISSPGDNEDNYFDHLRCTWHISAPIGQVVTIKFTKLNLEKTYSCIADRIVIYNGNQVNDTNEIEKICGQVIDDFVVKAGQNAVVQFISDGSVSRGGFKAYVYFTYPCDKDIYLNPNEETSAVSQKNYRPNEECHFRIITTSGYNLRVTFDSLVTRNCSLHSSRKCTCEFIEMRDGSNKYSDLIGHFCLGNVPSTKITSDNVLWMRSFTTGLPNGVLRFATKIKSVPSLCGDTIVANVSGAIIETVTSPGFPNTPPSNIRCSWSVSSPTESGSIIISFQDINLDGALPCNFTSSAGASDAAMLEISPEMPAHRFGLTIHDIYVWKSKYIFCGTTKPPAVIGPFGNFKIFYHSGTNPKPKAFRLFVTDIGCSGNYTELSGLLYFVNTIPCNNYIIAPSTNYTIAMYFSTFMVYTISEDCSSTALEILDGLGNNAPRLAKLCGNEIPPPVFSNSSSITIRLISTVGRSYHQVSLTYIATDAGRGCGGYLRDYHGTFTSPMYPQNYRKSSYCVWTIEAHGSTVPVIKFVTFDLGNKETCQSDFIEFFDVDESGLESFRARYCGGDTPAVFRGNYHRVIIKYTSSVHNIGQGWHLKYRNIGTGMDINSAFADI